MSFDRDSGITLWRGSADGRGCDELEQMKPFCYARTASCTCHYVNNSLLGQG